jgi:hypothetical protein
MLLKDVSALVDIFSGAAVAVTLVYLAFQIRQNAKHQRGTISHSRSAHVQQLMRSAATSDALMETVLKGWAGDQGMTRVQVNQFYWFVAALLTMFQDTYHQRREGMVSPLMYDSSLRTLRFQLAQPGTRAAWLVGRETFEPSFATFIDELIAATPLASTADVAERWRALAAERSSG